MASRIQIQALIDAKLRYFHSEQILAPFSTVNESFNALQFQMYLL